MPSAASFPPDRSPETWKPSAGQPETRTVSVTLVAETTFREEKRWRWVAETAVARATEDLLELAGLQFEVDEVLEWDPQTSFDTLSTALHEAARFAGPRDAITVVVVGKRVFEQLPTPSVSMTLQGRSAMILASAGFRDRLGRSPADHLAWLFRHGLGVVLGAPERPVAGIMNPSVREQEWSYDGETLAIIRASRTRDFSSPVPFAGCDLNALQQVFTHLDDGGEADVVSLVNLGVTFHFRRKPEAARDLFDRALREDPGSTAARLGLAQTLVALGDTTAGRSLIENLSVSDLSPAEVGVLGGLWGSLALHERADDLLTAAIQADSTRFSVWFKRGLSRFRQERYEEARADFEQALALEERPEGWFNLGLACDAIGDGGCLSRAFRRFLDLEPSGEQAEQARRFLKRAAGNDTN